MGRQRSKLIWHIWDRKDSPYWWVWRYDENDPNGKKRIRKKTKHKKSNLTREQIERISNVVQFGIVDNSGIEYTIEWLESFTLRKCRLEGLSEKTKKDYITIIGVLKSIYGKEYSILNIRRESVDDIKESLMDKVLQAGAINSYLRGMRAAFQRLVDDEKINRNPFARFKPLPEDKKKRHMTYSELIDFLKYVKENATEDIWRICRIYANTGRRRNEILDLNRNDVDIERGIYRPINIKSRDKHQITRRIPDENLIDFQYFLTKYDDKEYLFQIYSKRELTRKITKLFREKGHETLTLHSFRHTFITILREKGIDPRDIQVFIDHADLSTTLGYAHEKSLEVLSIGIRRE
ncbi:MAG: tyrosine-type recombinase/integrase [Bacteroidales bacterium]|nr:tyrosine-type recombinase/integrase [Bacteroidales bacterium]